MAARQPTGSAQTWLSRAIDWLEACLMALPFAETIKWAGSNWWHLRDLRRVVWACRAQLLSLAIGGGLIALTDQARDIVIGSAIGTANFWDKVGVIVTMLLWASVSWYWARVTLNFSFALPAVDADPSEWNGLTKEQRERRTDWRKKWQMRMPRLIGAASVFLVAVAFFKAGNIYREAGSPKAFTFFVWSAAFVLLSVAFYFVVSRRDQIMARLFGDKAAGAYLVPQRVTYDRIRDYDNPVAVAFMVGSAILAPVFSFLFIAYPVGTSEAFGDAVRAILFGLAVVVPIVSLLVLVSQSLRVPVFGLVLLWMLLSQSYLFGDNHDVRTLEDGRKGGQTTSHEACVGSDQVDKPARPTIGKAFEDWYAASEKLPRGIRTANDPARVQPMIVVATAGGASRAAFWTSQVLSEIAAREGHFADRLFMISGVSGGSLGAATFRSLVERQRREGAAALSDEQFAEKARTFLQSDFLTPALATGLYVDLPYHAFSFLPAPGDRAAALEKGWEAKACDSVVTTTGDRRFAWSDGFLATFNRHGPVWPILALNGTAVEKGKRLIVSNVDFGHSDMSGPMTRYDGLNVLGRDIRISTAVTMSARFPVVSPTGGLRDAHNNLQMRVTDGGLFENFGAVTADEVIRYIVERRTDAQEAIRLVAPIAILISSDPSLDLLDRATNTGRIRNMVDPTAQPPYRDQAIPDCNHRASVESAPGNDWPECPTEALKTATILVDPALALYDGRVARGELAAISLLDRINGSRVYVRDRLAMKLLEARTPGGPTTMDAARVAAMARLGTSNHIDFFHFRQCRLKGQKTPTMSWHDSDEAWQAMADMTGLDPKTADECGNAAEFFRLCTRLAYLSGAVSNDVEATSHCEQKKTPLGLGWRKPKNWECIPKDGNDDAKICGILR